MLTWSTLRGYADLDHVVLGTACWLVGSVFLLLWVAHPPDAWKLGTVDGLVVRVAFLLLGVAVLLLGVAFLLDRWSLVGVPFLLFGVAAPLSGVAALLDGWTLVGVALLLARSRHCCLGSRSCLTDGHRPGSHSCCSESRRSLGLGSWCRC